MKIKALSLLQPWASLIPGPKSLETRGWNTSYRGPLLICSSKRVMSWSFLLELGKQAVWREALASIFGSPPGDAYIFAEWIRQHLPYGQAVAHGDLVATYPTESLTPEQIGDNLPFGDFRPKRFAFDLQNRKAIAQPFPVWGRLGLFEVEIPEGVIE